MGGNSSPGPCRRPAGTPRGQPCTFETSRTARSPPPAPCQDTLQSGASPISWTARRSDPTNLILTPARWVHAEYYRRCGHIRRRHQRGVQIADRCERRSPAQVTWPASGTPVTRGRPQSAVRRSPLRPLGPRVTPRPTQQVWFQLDLPVLAGTRSRQAASCPSSALPISRLRVPGPASSEHRQRTD